MRLARAEVAFVNEGNSRGDLDRGPITYAQLFRASAYEHQVLRLKLTGAQIRAVLREQFDRPGGEVPLHLAGIRYRREGERVAGVQVSGGRALQDGRRYVVAANELLVQRGGFATLSANAAGGRAVGTDLEALVGYVEERGSVR
jgi:2',3'-cyclic-nucleotide 2'-phosphodiesterase (5'-nucleotidase family)